jgi:hypothetical protein
MITAMMTIAARMTGISTLSTAQGTDTKLSLDTALLLEKAAQASATTGAFGWQRLNSLYQNLCSVFAGDK